MLVAILRAILLRAADRLVDNRRMQCCIRSFSVARFPENKPPRMPVRPVFLARPVSDKCVV